jgi:hypothetical protein
MNLNNMQLTREFRRSIWCKKKFFMKKVNDLIASANI